MAPELKFGSFYTVNQGRDHIIRNTAVFGIKNDMVFKLIEVG